MNGMVILIIGIVLMAAAVALFAASLVYRKTAGRKIREELKKEYE